MSAHADRRRTARAPKLTLTTPELCAENDPKSTRGSAAAPATTGTRQQVVHACREQPITTIDSWCRSASDSCQAAEARCTRSSPATWHPTIRSTDGTSHPREQPRSSTHHQKPTTRHHLQQRRYSAARLITPAAPVIDVLPLEAVRIGQHAGNRRKSPAPVPTAVKPGQVSHWLWPMSTTPLSWPLWVVCSTAETLLIRPAPVKARGCHDRHSHVAVMLPLRTRSVRANCRLVYVASAAPP
jgi:hypothetical protein